MYAVIDRETLLAAKRKDTRELAFHFAWNGELREVHTRLVNGEMEARAFTRPFGEMLTTPEGLYAVVEKTTIDLNLGREAVPLLYGPIYRRQEDPSFTQDVRIRLPGEAQVVFLEHLELEEVRFGARKLGPVTTVPIVTYAAGFEWTEDMVEFDQTFQMAEINRSVGEAYNHLLNHLHFAPIISYTYPAKNKTAADTTGSTYREKLRATIRNGLKHASQDKIAATGRVRRPTILLAHPSNRMDIEEALQAFVVQGTEYAALRGIDTLIFYEGASLTVGERTYDYPGVPTDKAYLIDPQQWFRELVKHDLRIDAATGDLSRLVQTQLVARARRGVYAAPENAVEELTLPS